MEACKSLAIQNFSNFEVCISDDCSTDGREKEIFDFLNQSKLSFFYKKQGQNRRYDANLREAIAMARGQFCLLLGNDDVLASSTVLEELYADLKDFGKIGVVISNYADFSTGRQFRRVKKTDILGAGPEAAIRYFRSFSFVSGILLRTSLSKEFFTKKWDGSEMYQMFIGCRILAKGFQDRKSVV